MGGLSGCFPGQFGPAGHFLLSESAAGALYPKYVPIFLVIGVRRYEKQHTIGERESRLLRLLCILNFTDNLGVLLPGTAST